MEVVYRFIVGGIHCGTVREYLKKQEFFGRNIKFTESSGLIQREFLIKGEKNIVSELQVWANR